MALKLITGPAVEPVSRAEVKDSLGIRDTVSDDKIDRLIIAARKYAENNMRIAIINQTWELALDQFPEEIELTKTPASSITQITYIDTAGSTQTLSALTYGLDNYGVRHWVLPAIDQEWPDTYDTANAVKVRWVAGFGADSTAVPEEIRQAIMLTVGHWVNYQSEAELGTSVLMVPRAVDQLLSPHRIHLI